MFALQSQNLPFLFLFVLLLLSLQRGSSLDLSEGSPLSFFISPSGSDTEGDGTISSPWATPSRAQQAVRDAVALGANSDIFVYLRGGLYSLSSTLEFNSQDSAPRGFTIHWSSYPGDSSPPLLHGGAVISNWKLVDSSRNLYVASLPDGVLDTRQVYVDNVRVIPTLSGPGGFDSWTITEYGYTTDSTTCPPGWNDPLQSVDDIELRYTGSGSSWTECRVRISTITSLPNGGCNITMKSPGFQLARNKFYGQGVSHPVYLQNIVSLLSAQSPGQGVVNSATRSIYYVPLPGQDMTKVFSVVPRSDVEVLVSMIGDESGTTLVPVRGVSLEGLTFAYAGGLEFSGDNGYVDMQSSFRVLPTSTVDDTTWEPIHGNLRFYTVENVTITNCTFMHLGQTAIEIADGSQGVSVVNNTFADVSCGAIYFGQVNDLNISAARENRDFYIAQNFAVGVPVEFYDCSVILGGFVVNSTITSNTIINNSNTGISMGWGWSRDEAANSGSTLISKNWVDGSNWLLEDGGSIYVLGPQPNSQMIENYISHQKKLFGALYTDEGSAYWYIARNVVHDVPEWLHVWTSSIHDELIELNWSDQTYEINHGTNCTERNNVFIKPGDPFPQDAQAIINSAGVSWMNGPK
jgi:hypothetical protein